MTVADLITAYGLGLTCERRTENLFRCRLTCEDRGMTFHHLSPSEPSLAEVLTRLAAGAKQHVRSKLDTDLSANRDMASFKHWCVLYGFNPASVDDRQLYLILRRRSEQLKYVIGIEAYKQLLEIT